MYVPHDLNAVLGAVIAKDITGCDIIIAEDVTPFGFVIEAVTIWPMPEDIDRVRVVNAWPEAFVFILSGLTEP